MFDARIIFDVEKEGFKVGKVALYLDATAIEFIRKEGLAYFSAALFAGIKLNSNQIREAMNADNSDNQNQPV